MDVLHNFITGVFLLQGKACDGAAAAAEQVCPASGQGSYTGQPGPGVSVALGEDLTLMLRD